MAVNGVIDCSMLYPALCLDESGGPGFHNTYLSFIIIFALIWSLHRLSKIIEFYEMIRIIQEEGKVVKIPSFGPYSNDLKRLMRIHISQIIRERCSVSPTVMRKARIASILDDTTLRTRLVPNSSSSSNPDESYSLDISFKVDSDVPFSVQFLWGVDYNEANKLLIKETTMNESGKNSQKLAEGSALELRRMGLGSSIQLYDHMVKTENESMILEHQLVDAELERKGSFQGHNYSHLGSVDYGENSPGKTGFEDNNVNLSLSLDFSPRESLLSLAQVNPILYTTEMTNYKGTGNQFGYREKSNGFTTGVNGHYFNINSASSRSAGVPTLFERMASRIGDFLPSLFHRNTSADNSRWNRSLLGNNTVILSKIIKKVFNRVLYRITDFNGAATESLLNLSDHTNNISQSSNNNDSCISIEKGKSYSGNKKGNINCGYGDFYYNCKCEFSNKKSDISLQNIGLMEKLNPIYASSIKYFEKGLSQECTDKIRLTPEYVSSCHILSPYFDNNYDTGLNESEGVAEDVKCIKKSAFEINNSSNNGIIEKGNNGASEMPRVPLLILIRSNLDLEVEKDITNSNIILVHFELIQDHYNPPYLLYKPIVIKQILTCMNGNFLQPYDTFGLEDDELDCLICMSNPKDVILLPCRHCISCEKCLRSLRQDKCPLCRTTFYGFVVLPIKNKV
ncbi:putative E3 ubiquitin-protein ligase [Cryptosporidium felis]|nr:putative E3 ubiquitin-protein ligase [Cryptosporidium felis]